MKNACIGIYIGALGYIMFHLHLFQNLGRKIATLLGR